MELSPCAFCDCRGLIEDHTGKTINFIYTCNGFRQPSLDPEVACVSRIERQRDAEGKRTIPIIGYLIRLPVRRPANP